MGHENKHGGGALNIFGKAFKEAGFEWTNALCMADTDGDGESNGLELGDPCCIWRVGLTPMRQWGLSHPAIAESRTNLDFHYNTTCRSKQGDKEFWKFYFNKDTSFKYKTFSEDFGDWITRQRAILNETKGLSNYLQLLHYRRKMKITSTKDLLPPWSSFALSLRWLYLSSVIGVVVVAQKRLSLKDHAWLLCRIYLDVGQYMSY